MSIASRLVLFLLSQLLVVPLVSVSDEPNHAPGDLFAGIPSGAESYEETIKPECEIFRGDTYVGEVPEVAVIQAQANKIIDAPRSNHVNWQKTKEWIRTVLKYAAVIMRAQGDSQPYMDAINDVAGKEIRDFLSVPAPAIPCDQEYMKHLFALAELGMCGLSHNPPAVEAELEKRINDVTAWCWVRYEIEIDYKSTLNTPSGWWGSRVRGRVPFFVNIEDNFRVQGNGQLEVTGIGGDLLGGCKREDSGGSGSLVITGRMHFKGEKEKIRPELELQLKHDINVTETWNCPGVGGSGRTTHSLGEFPEADQVLHIVARNGNRISQSSSSPGGLRSVDLTWILHIVERNEKEVSPLDLVPTENSPVNQSGPASQNQRSNSP